MVPVKKVGKTFYEFLLIKQQTKLSLDQRKQISAEAVQALKGSWLARKLWKLQELKVNGKIFGLEKGLTRLSSWRIAFLTQTAIPRQVKMAVGQMIQTLLMSF